MIKKIKLPALITAVIVFLILLQLPVFVNKPAHNAFSILILVAILWVTEAIPLALTGLMIPMLASMLHLTTTKEAFTEFANPIIFLFMGGFVLAGALSRHSLDKILSHKLIGFAKGNFYRSSILLMFATSVCASWVGNTTSTAMMIPLAMGMLVLVKRNMISPESKFLLLGIAYSANLGGVVTMIATPPNAIGAAILKLSFTEWMAYGFPMFLMTFPVMILVLTLYFKPDRKMRISDVAINIDAKAPNKLVAAIFLFTVLLWVLESVLSPLLNVENFSALVAVMAIFLICITRVLSWQEIIKSVRWEVLLLFGGGLTLGMLIESSGLGAIMISKVSLFISSMPLFVFIWAIVIFSILLTEFMSNTASAAMILPLLFTLANELHINPVMLVLPATIATSYGFMLPVGTPPNAMAFSTGFIPQIDMIKVGAILNVSFSILLTLFFYFIFR